MSGVIIGVDPHKVSATIEVLGDGEQVLKTGRFGTDRAGFRAMLAAGRVWPERIWAVEGCQGIGRHVAQRLVADGEIVVDVPAKLSARARVFSTGQGRKTDATDAHSIAVVAAHTTTLRPVAREDELMALRLLADRREELANARTQAVSRLLTPQMWRGSRPGRTSRPGTAPPRSMPPAANRSATACRGQATGGSTACCTSWPSSSCATTPRAGPTSGARSPPERPRWKPCGASNDGYPT